MKTGVNMRLRYSYPKLRVGSYTQLMKTLESTFKYEQSDVARFRLRVLTFFEKYGLQATMEAYPVGKSTLYEWRSLFKKGGDRLSALVPKSTRPHRTRQMEVEPELVEFIREIREKYGRIGKDKLKPLLDAYAESIGEESYGKTKIGKIIKRHNYFFTGKKVKRKQKQRRKRTKYAPRVDKPGYVELDSVTVYINSKKLYFITVIDVYTKIAYAKRVPSLAACHAVSTLKAYQELIDYKIVTVQTDNGSEFLGDFEAYCEKEEIEHIFTYARSPKVNGVVERFNRTLQEEYVERCEALWFDKEKADLKLSKYLEWYNHFRPHHSLKFLTPMAFSASLVPNSS